MSKAEQDEAIDALLEEEPIRKMWDEYERDLLATVHFLKNSGRYRLYAPGNLGKGDFNVYRSFAEHALSVTKSGGFAAQIVPGGLYGGANASAIRKALIDQHDWRFLLICENRRSVFFPGVHPQTWFAVYAARVGRGPAKEIKVGFGIDSIEALLGWQRKSMRLSADSIREQQPETYAIPDSGSADEAAVSAKMYSSSPGFGEDIEGVPLRVYQAEIHMGNDRDLLVEDHVGFPVFEGRMIAPFDYRAKKYLSGHGNNSKWLETPFGHPEKSISPQWRVPDKLIPKKVKDRVTRYRVGFGDVANPRNERTFISSLIPPGTICGHKVPTFTFEPDEEWAYLPYLAIANSYCIDFLARQRTVTLSMSFTVLDSLPIPRLDKGDWRTRALAPRALRLAAAGLEMLDFWNQMASQGWGMLASGPSDLISLAATTFEERHRLLAEIEVIVARDVYGLSKDDLRIVMNTFPVLAKREVRAHGSFVTRDRVLDLYDTLVVPR